MRGVATRVHTTIRSTIVVVSTALVALVVHVGGSAPTHAQQRDDPYPGYSSPVYADPASWLCRPDTDDPCDEDLDATVVEADGTTRIQRFKRAKQPKVDCFYVYPTVSSDPTTNSDLVADPAVEGYTIRNQAARLQSKCRLFAPMYRQMTLTAALARRGLGPPPVDGVSRADAQRIAYESVLDAWKHYIANDNDGRGVVLFGHSQGSWLLGRLIAEEIDDEPSLRDRLVSAVLLGAPVGVPPGQDVGGDFQQVRLCRDDEQLGCVISYESFRATAPPTTSTSLFGHTELGPAACTNPGALDGGTAQLEPYFMTDNSSGGGLLGRLGVAGQAPTWLDPAAGQITTPWVMLPGLVEAECVTDDGVGYLAISVRGDPSGPRIDDVRGDLPGGLGLHLLDANVAMGDLVRVVGRQAEAYATR
jgi:hypothetical protein